MNSNTNSRQSTNTRIYYFDAIKTLAIFLVIFVHYPMISDSIPSNLSMLLTYVAVPLFFIFNARRAKEIFKINNKKKTRNE